MGPAKKNAQTGAQWECHEPDILADTRCCADEIIDPNVCCES